MTALEAYALAKKIAKSAVSGIKSFSVSGTTLTIETNDGNTIDMVFPVPADGRGITKAEINTSGHLIITYDDGTTQDAGAVPGSDVEVTSLLSHGTKIAKIEVNGVSTDLYAPQGGGGSGDYFIIDTLDQRPDDLTSDDRKIYYCIETKIFYLWDGTEWSEIKTNGTVIRELTLAAYEALSPEEKMNGTMYFVIDADSPPATSIIDDTIISLNKTWSSDKINTIKQDKLIFDPIPMVNSKNSVTSGGIYNYIDTMITNALTGSY